MSVVVKQGIKYSLVGYLGFALGTFSNFFIFPYDLEFYGKLRFIFPMAEMLVPIVVFGISFANVKFFAQTQKEGKHQNMLSLSLMGICINFVIFSLFYFLIFNLFPELKNSKSWDLKHFILPLILFLSVSAVLNKYISNYKRIAIPNIFENLFPKLANIGAFCVFFFLGISENWSLTFFLAFFLVSMLGYFIYNHRLEPFKFNFHFDYFLQNKLWHQILAYSFFGFLGNIGSFLALKIANVMISEYIGFEENGLYSNIYSITALIMIPQMGIFNISAPMINQYLSENKISPLNEFHQKTSLNLFLLGLVLFSCILVGFPFLTQFMKNGILLQKAEPILWIIGGAMLFDLATGFNSHIISLSPLYKYNTAFMLVLAFLTIGMNALFLHYTNLGILGIAISYATSLTLFNLIKIVFNYHHFRVFPLSWTMLKGVFLSAGAIFITSFFPNTDYVFINLVYKPTLLIGIILLGNIIFKIYPLSKLNLKK